MNSRSITPDFSESARMVLRERYLRRDEAGRLIEDAHGMLRRVASAIAAPARMFGEDAVFWEERFLPFMGVSGWNKVLRPCVMPR